MYFVVIERKKKRLQNKMRMGLNTHTHTHTRTHTHIHTHTYKSNKGLITADKIFDLLSYQRKSMKKC